MVNESTISFENGTASFGTNGSSDASTNAGNIVQYTSAGNQYVISTTYQNLIFIDGNSNRSDKYLSGNVVVNGDFTLEANTDFYPISYDMDVAGTAIIKDRIYDNNLSGTSTFSGNAIIDGATFDGSVNGNVVFDGTLTALTIGFTIDRCSFTMNLALTVPSGVTVFVVDGNGTKTFSDITVENGGTWSNTGNSAITINGDLTVNNGATFTQGTGIYTFNGTGKSITGTIPDLDFQNIIIDGTITNSIADVDITGDITVNSGSITNKDNILLSYNQLVQLYAKLHNYKQAYHYLLEGIEYANKTNRKISLPELYITAGNLFLNNNINDDAAFAYFQEAKTFFTDEQDASKNHYIDLCIGELYLRNGNDSLALKTFQQVISKPDVKSDKDYLSDAYLKMGLLKIKKKQYDSALYYLQESIDNICSTCSETEIHRALIEKSKIYLLIGQTYKARETLLKSITIAKNVNARYKLLLSEEVLARYYLDVKNIDSAKFYLFNVYNLSQAMGVHEKIRDAAKSLSNIYYTELTEFDLIRFAKDMVNTFEIMSHQTRCKLVFHSNISSVKIKFDRDKLYSMVSNLLSNAFKFSDKEGEVLLNIEARANRVQITVRDKGQGIAEEQLKKIGKRYYQANETSLLSEGSGIGLAYVKELVAFFNGKFKIASHPQTGTTVQFIIPCPGMEIFNHNPELLEIIPSENILQQVNEMLQEDNMPGKPVILVVEDNADLRTFICNIFNPGFITISAGNGESGLGMAVKHNPDLIISDIMMPGVQGCEMCRMLKKDIRTSHIPIILLTAKDARDDQIEGYQCGADDYIVKPFDTELLFQKVKNIFATIENTRKQFNFTDIGNKKMSLCSEPDRQLLKKCLALINENLSNPKFTAELLSEEIGLSKRTLLRKFNSLTGKSPAYLIKHARMSHAALLLREKNLRVNEVSLLVGYEDPERFSNAFKLFFGVTPTGYCK